MPQPFYPTPSGTLSPALSALNNKTAQPVLPRPTTTPGYISSPSTVGVTKPASNNSSSTLPWLQFNKPTPGLAPIAPTGTTGNTNTGTTGTSGATTSGLPTTKPTTPLKKTTTANADGSTTTQEYHAPATTGSTTDNSSTTPPPVTPPVVPPTAPTVPTTTGTPQVGTTAQNYQNVLDQGNLNNNPTWQALAQQNGNIVQAQQNAAAVPYGSSATQPLGQSYANINRPGQTTGALAGELNGFNVGSSAALSGNAAEAGMLQTGQGMSLDAAKTVAAASNLSPTAQGQASFSALGGYQSGGNYFGDPSDPQTAVNAQSFNTLGTQTAQAQAELNGLQANSTLLTNTLNAAGTNAGTVPYLNALNQAVQRGLISPADLSAFQAMVTQLQAEGVTISPNDPLATVQKELAGQIAQKQNVIAGNQAQMAKLLHPGTTSSSSSSTGATGAFSDSSFYGTD